MCFTDSHLIASALRQSLEPKGPSAVVFTADDGPVTVGEVLHALDGRPARPAVEVYLIAIVREAIKLAHGSFNVGLQTTSPTSHVQGTWGLGGKR